MVCASDGREMQGVLACENVDLCILDIGFPGKIGLDITRDLRAKTDLPILILPGRDETVKPFEPRELLARIRTILRRANAANNRAEQQSPPSYEFGNWLLAPAERTLCKVDTGEQVALTTGEFELLHLFAAHPSIAYSRDQLLDTARGRASFAGDRAIDVYIMRLCKKLSPNPTDPGVINTIHSIGYSFVARMTQTL